MPRFQCLEIIHIQAPHLIQQLNYIAQNANPTGPSLYGPVTDLTEELNWLRSEINIREAFGQHNKEIDQLFCCEHEQTNSSILPDVCAIQRHFSALEAKQRVKQTDHKTFEIRNLRLLEFVTY